MKLINTYESDNKLKGDQLWEDYVMKKKYVKTLIHQKITQQRFEKSVQIAKAGVLLQEIFGKNLEVFLKRTFIISKTSGFRQSHVGSHV